MVFVNYNKNIENHQPDSLTVKMYALIKYVRKYMIVATVNRHI